MSGRHARAALGAALLALWLAPSVHAQANPLAWPAETRESRPWTRWWWLGSAVTPAGLTAELEAMDAAGIGGVEVTSIYGARGAESAFVPYLSDQWIALLAHASREAGRLGMGLDLPPGSGWRMGGPAVPAGEGSTSLRVRVDTVAGGAAWHRPAGERVAAVMALSDAGDRQPIPATAARWTAPAGRWRVFTAELPLNGELVKRPAPGGEGRAVNVLSPPAVDSYLTGFARRLDSLPDGAIRAYFHDSYEYTGDSSTELFATFRRLRGYPLERYLPALAGVGDADTVARVKADYRETMSDLLLADLVRPFTDWAHRQGARSRNQAHGSPGNLLDLYAASDIPETEIFGPLGGTDSDPLVSKFASSAAHLAGRPLVSAEAMTWLGEHFTVTLAQIRQAADQLFVSGVNHLFYHGTAYSPPEAAWPGWLFYASTQVNPRNPIWREMPALNAYIQRVQGVMQSGEPDAEVLLYWPVHDSWHDPSGRRMDFKVHEPRWLRRMPVGQAAEWLWERGYPFDYLSDRLLAERVQVRGGRLSTGHRVLLVPRTERMPPETLDRLLALARQGGTVLFHHQLPHDVPGLRDLDGRRRRLARLRGSLRFAGAGAVRRARVGRGHVMVGEQLDSLLQAGGASREAMADHAGLRFARRRHSSGRHYFVALHGGPRIDGWVPLATEARGAVILDPLTGRAGVARVRATAGARTEVYLQLEPGESRVLRTLDRAPTGPAWPYHRPAGGSIPLTGEWQVEFVEGGPEIPASFTTAAPGSWAHREDPAAQRFGGTARYTLRFDAPASAAAYRLELGRVAESARLRLNGADLGTRFSAPYQWTVGPLRPVGNVLEVEVTNLAANRIRDLDRRGVSWKIFHDINFVGIDYRPFNASAWPVRESGLLGPVTLLPLAEL